MPANFITIDSQTTTGTLGALPRGLVLVTREEVAGSPSPTTGLSQVNESELATFEAANPDSLGLINALRAIFAQSPTYDTVYILSAPAGVTAGDLNDANVDPRAWNFLSLVSQYQGDGTGAPGNEHADYFADLTTMVTWASLLRDKLVLHTYSCEESGDVITLPAELALGSTLGSNNKLKTVVSNAQHAIGDPSAQTVYDNIAVAWLAYNINSPFLARSWGSLSDAHDFAYVDGDTYSITSRNIIENASLAQYNGAKDRAGSLFVYDTQMNDDVNPPLSRQIETDVSIITIEDRVYVDVHNALQAAGEPGVSNDDKGIQRAASLVVASLLGSFSLNLILAKEDGNPDFTVGTKTAAQVTASDPSWVVTGKWPSGVVSAKVKAFSAAHYITINFAF